MVSAEGLIKIYGFHVCSKKSPSTYDMILDVHKLCSFSDGKNSVRCGEQEILDYFKARSDSKPISRDHVPGGQPEGA